MVAPPGTPSAIVDKVSAAVADALRQPDVARTLGKMNVAGIGDTPAEFAKFLHQERSRWGGVIRKLGLRVE
jgi:tripartite-type tricarboxylate transporter receptor subunit TctC